MQRISSICRGIFAAAVMTIAMVLLTVNAVSAHAGHAHTDDGIGTTTLMQVGGAVLALGVVYLVVNRKYQMRDTRASRTELDATSPADNPGWWRRRR